MPRQFLHEIFARDVYQPREPKSGNENAVRNTHYSHESHYQKN